MIKEIINYIKKDLRRNYKFYIVLLLIMSLFVIKLDYYIYSPGDLIDLTDRIEVDNSYKQKGSFNMTYVTSRDGSIINVLLSYIIPSWELESVDDMRYEEESTKEINLRDKVYLKETSYDAIISAFKEAGKDYKIENIDVTVTYVMKESNNSLKVGDIIKSVNGNVINNVNDLKNEISKYKSGDTVDVHIIRNNKDVDVKSTLFENDNEVLIGVHLAELKNVITNPEVNFIFKDNESGSSRGLMCALDIYNKITEFDLTKGRVISGTGVIDEDGNVGSISGVKYKLIGAYNSHASIFIVPKDNYDEALEIKEKYKMNIELISASNLHDVIEKLK